MGIENTQIDEIIGDISPEGSLLVTIGGKRFATSRLNDSEKDTR